MFELGDAVLLTVHANSFAEFSSSPAFRRQWPSVYEALQDGRPDRSALLRLYLDQMVWVEHPILVGDYTAWSRLEAYTLRDRTIEHQPTSVPGAKPITVGQGYLTLAWVPESRGSWALPLLHERGAGCVKTCRHLPTDRGSALARQTGHSSGVPGLGGWGVRGRQALERGRGTLKSGQI